MSLGRSWTVAFEDVLNRTGFDWSGSKKAGSNSWLRDKITSTTSGQQVLLLLLLSEGALSWNMIRRDCS